MPVGISQVTQICSGGLTSLRAPVGTAHTCCHIRNDEMKFDTDGVLLMLRARLQPQVAITTQRLQLLYTFETARVT